MPKLTGEWRVGVVLDSNVGVPVRLGNLNVRSVGGFGECGLLLLELSSAGARAVL
jgi:hypothetical protein